MVPSTRVRMVICGLVFLSAIIALPAQDPPGPAKRDDVFGADRLWTIQLKIGAKEYQAMNPKGGMFGFGFPKKVEPKKDDKPADAPTDVHKSKGFGMEFPWVKGDLEFEGKLVKDVGIRYTGNSTYQMSAQGIKRPFKIDINHYIEDQKLHGLASLTLRNGAADSTRLRDALGYGAFRAAGVPAPRTAFAKLHLSVPEKHDNTYAGLYTLVETVDKPFLKKHFGADKGMLLKPERIQGLPYLGESWSAYEDKFNPRREPTKKQQRRLIEFTKLVNQADDVTFQKKIADYLDVEAFLRFAAVNNLVGNLDSFFGLGHNYYMYLSPKTNQFYFIPWDLDLAFGGMMFGGGDVSDWAIAQPYTGKNRLAERILAVKEYNDAYRRHVKNVIEGACSVKAMNTALDEMEKTIKPALAKEPAAKGFGFGFGFGPKQDLRGFVKKRSESVLAQLDGKSSGTQLAGFGFGAPPKGGNPFALGNRLAKPIVEFADIDKNSKLSPDEFKSAAEKLFKEAGGDDKTSVTEEALIDTINRLMPAPPAFGGFKPPPPPKGSGPGKGIASAILKHVGAGADKTVSRAPFLEGAEKLHKQWDKDKNGSLDEKELVDGINQFSPPPAFGPFVAPGPGDAKKELPGKEKPKERSP